MTVPLAADARVLRFRLAHLDGAAADGRAVFEEWTAMQPVSAAPVVAVDAVAPGYTNAVVSGSIGSFGIGGSKATVTIEVAPASDPDFTNPFAAATLPAVSALGSFEADLFGFATNADYLVRARAENDLEETGVGPAVAFRTRRPRRPWRRRSPPSKARRSRPPFRTGAAAPAARRRGSTSPRTRRSPTARR